MSWLASHRLCCLPACCAQLTSWALTAQAQHTDALRHKLAGKAIKGVPRDQVVLASKWGPTFDEKMKPGHDASPEAARKGVERALQNLGVDYIDLLILRSTGPTVPIEESVKGMAVSHQTPLQTLCLCNMVCLSLLRLCLQLGPGFHGY